MNCVVELFEFQLKRFHLGLANGIYVDRHVPAVVAPIDRHAKTLVSDGHILVCRIAASICTVQIVQGMHSFLRSIKSEGVCCRFVQRG